MYNRRSGHGTRPDAGGSLNLPTAPVRRFRYAACDTASARKRAWKEPWSLPFRVVRAAFTGWRV